MRQALEIPMQLPTPQLKEHPMSRSKRVKRQRRTVRKALELMAKRVPLPCVVTLIRVSRGTADTDRAALSLAAVRDEVARWLCDVPFERVDPDTGKVTTPRAPDGPNDPIVWRYGQVKTKQMVTVVRKGQLKRVGYQAAQIIIETTNHEEMRP